MRAITATHRRPPRKRSDAGDLGLLRRLVRDLLDVVCWRRAIAHEDHEAEQQTLPRQRRALKAYAKQRGWTVVHTVEDVGSGATERPKRAPLLRAARRRELDVILVWKLDRWGRSVADLVVSLQELQELGVGFVSLTEASTRTTTSGRAMAGLLAVFAEFERDLLRERILAGIENARAKGVQLGRPPTAQAHAAEVLKLAEKQVSQAEIARRLGIGRTSVRRILNER